MYECKMWTDVDLVGRQRKYRQGIHQFEQHDK